MATRIVVNVKQVASQQPAPRLEPVLVSRFRIAIGAAPNFCRRLSIEVLVRTDVLVAAAKQIEVVVELCETGHLSLVELLLLFEGAEEAFDSALLPWAARIGTLMADAQSVQSDAKLAGGKHGFVVGSDEIYILARSAGWVDKERGMHRRRLMRLIKRLK